MNGLEFLRRLRKEPGGGEPKVVFCSVENDLDRIREALEEGADEYIMKPFDGDIVASKLTWRATLQTPQDRESSPASAQSASAAGRSMPRRPTSWKTGWVRWRGARASGRCTSSSVRSATAARTD